ncbi:GNAT family N-acetyltransferase [Saliphagus sp. LR7]|uniref:GNAT family N-acetyltransferase n=1 Tax=Saliphagus sp. LR7 TaxID=2282654 RepID=UPI000DF7B997|nr:GNAT family N-acetyltransferase [Saliphagus sp. LR7]
MSDDGERADDPAASDDTDATPLIEPATDDDLPALVSAWIALAGEQEAYGSHIRPEENREAIRDVLLAHTFDDDLLVARIDDAIAGFASVSMENGLFELDVARGRLSNLYVTPAHRDRGIGTALLEAAEDRLRAEGADVLSLEAMADNADARRFYRANGYHETRVTMERRLEDRGNDTHSKEER